VVAEMDRGADKDVSTKAAAVDEWTKKAWARQLLEMSAGLGETAPDGSAWPTRKRRPTTGFSDAPRVTTFRRDRSHGRSSSSRGAAARGAAAS
jgi:hypothetical protein